MHVVNDGTDPEQRRPCWMECRSCGDLDADCWEGHDRAALAAPAPKE